jgi:hypothetical protein
MHFIDLIQISKVNLSGIGGTKLPHSTKIILNDMSSLYPIDFQMVFEAFLLLSEEQERV